MKTVIGCEDNATSYDGEQPPFCERTIIQCCPAKSFRSQEMISGLYGVPSCGSFNENETSDPICNLQMCRDEYTHSEQPVKRQRCDRQLVQMLACLSICPSLSMMHCRDEEVLFGDEKVEHLDLSVNQHDRFYGAKLISCLFRIFWGFQYMSVLIVALCSMSYTGN